MKFSSDSQSSIDENMMGIYGTSNTVDRRATHNSYSFPFRLLDKLKCKPRLELETSPALNQQRLVRASYMQKKYGTVEVDGKMEQIMTAAGYDSESEDSSDEKYNRFESKKDGRNYITQSKLSRSFSSLDTESIMRKGQSEYGIYNDRYLVETNSSDYEDLDHVHGERENRSAARRRRARSFQRRENDTPIAHTKRRHLVIKKVVSPEETRRRRRNHSGRISGSANNKSKNEGERTIKRKKKRLTQKRTSGQRRDRARRDMREDKSKLPMLHVNIPAEEDKPFDSKLWLYLLNSPRDDDSAEDEPFSLISGPWQGCCYAPAPYQPSFPVLQSHSASIIGNDYNTMDMATEIGTAVDSAIKGSYSYVDSIGSSWLSVDSAGSDKD